MAKGLNFPHLLLASSNPMRMIQNLNQLLTQPELDKLIAELDRNVMGLFVLGRIHFEFASTLGDDNWRQKISRLYYSVYNVRRAIQLKHSGAFSTESSDHNNLDKLPETLENRESHTVNLKNLREDRNLADYSHLGVITDLVITPADAQDFATHFISDCRKFLVNQGMVI